MTDHPRTDPPFVGAIAPSPPSLRGETGDKLATLDAMMAATGTIPAEAHRQVIAQHCRQLRELIELAGEQPAGKTATQLVAQLRRLISREMPHA